ncbi:sigma-54-dependent Fis family transcriptional regulator [Methylolobus aquaticus]|nr:sigma-54-dependent Fis family transcriptional regulator [Methylolobus aquaticus]
MKTANPSGVLVISEPPDHRALPNLPDLAPWRWQHAHTPQEAQRLIGTGSFRVGIFDFRSAGGSAAFAGWHEEILRAKTQIQWLAVLPKHQLRDPRFADLVSNRFFAYQADPLEPTQFATLLEAASDMAALRLAHKNRANAGWVPGESPAMRRLDAQLTQSANAGVPILISGEVGTGKGLAASVIHQRSRRCHEDLRVINCVTLPGCLLPCDPDLPDDRRGDLEFRTEAAFRLATPARGTLVLDEIGDLSKSAQRVLLRWLDAHQHQTQLIAITHMDLPRAAEEGRFRGDLLHRLNELHLQMPPLRQRGDDLLLLAEHFIKANWALNRHVTRLSRPAIEAMLRYRWPGNVRELQARIRRAMLMSDDHLLHTEDLGLASPSGALRSVPRAAPPPWCPLRNPSSDGAHLPQGQYP